MEEDEWTNVKHFIQRTLKEVESRIGQQSIDSINHYVDHDEYEMAFEILFLIIMELKDFPKIDLLKSKQMAEFLKLNEETVYDTDFWNSFISYIQKHE